MASGTKGESPESLGVNTSHASLDPLGEYALICGRPQLQAGRERQTRVHNSDVIPSPVMQGPTMPVIKTIDIDSDMGA